MGGPGPAAARSYLNAVATGYGAGVAQVPFSTNPQRAADEINQAVSQATRGHIPRLVTPGMVNGIGWVLTSALYMNAAWATPFDPNQTSPGAFEPGGKAQPVTVKYMNGARFPLRLARRLDRGLAALQGREADDDRAAAPAGIRELRAAESARAAALTAPAGSGTAARAGARCRR